MENLGILAHNRSGVKIKEIKGRAPGSIDAFLNKDGLCRLQSTTLFIQGSVQFQGRRCPNILSETDRQHCTCLQRVIK